MRIFEINKNKNTVYFMMVYANPPSYGYKLAYEKLLNLSEGSDHVVFINPLQDQRLNPLPFEKTLQYNRKLFPNVKFYKKPDITTPLEALEYLSKKYEIVYMLTKDENIPKFQRFYSYAEDWGLYSFDIIGLGDTKSDETKGRTNELARKYVLENNFEKFKKTIPSDNNELLAKMFLDLRKNMVGNSKIKKDSKDDIKEAIEEVINFFEDKNKDFSILEEYFYKDEAGNPYIMLETINKKLKNIKMVISEKIKDYSIGKDKDNNYVLFLNSPIGNLDSKLRTEKKIFEASIKKMPELTETTSGAIASTPMGLGQPIKRRPSSQINLDFVYTIKNDKECHNKLQKSMKEFIDKYGYIDEVAISKIKEILQ